MQHRTFADRDGVVWRVSEVPADTRDSEGKRERRDTPRSSLRSSTKGKLLATRPHAWLYFESKSERRRVSSVPNRWEHLDDEELEDLLAHSRPVSKRPALKRKTHSPTREIE
jgi:hypothetical protein